MKRWLRCWLNGHRPYELNDRHQKPDAVFYRYVMFCSECGKLLSQGHTHVHRASGCALRYDE